MKKLTSIFLVLACIFAIFTLPALPADTKGNDIAVIVNPDTPVSELSLAEVRKVFRGERQYWTKDVPVVLLIRAPVAREREVVLKQLYGMTESQFKQYWIAKIFRAESTTRPKIVFSNKMATELVGVIPGAIAFVSQKDIPADSKVRVL